MIEASESWWDTILRLQPQEATMKEKYWYMIRFINADGKVETINREVEVFNKEQAKAHFEDLKETYKINQETEHLCLWGRCAIMTADEHERIRIQELARTDK